MQNFEKLLHSLKQAQDIDDLAKISMKNINSEDSAKPQFANNAQVQSAFMQVAQVFYPQIFYT